NHLLDQIRDAVRAPINQLAILLNKLSGGKLSPNAVTLFGLAMHVVIAYYIAQQRFVLAAILLLIFGLFDTLDGSLARLQKKDSSTGMLLDAVTDRMKEVLLYSGAAWYLAGTSQ